MTAQPDYVPAVTRAKAPRLSAARWGSPVTRVTDRGGCAAADRARLGATSRGARFRFGPGVYLHHGPAALADLAVERDALATVIGPAVPAVRRTTAPTAALARAALQDHFAVGLLGQGLAEGVIQVHSLAGDDEEQLAPDAFPSRHTPHRRSDLIVAARMISGRRPPACGGPS